MNRPGLLVVLGWSAFNGLLFTVLVLYTTIVYHVEDLMALVIYAGGLTLITAFAMFGRGGRREEGVPPRHHRPTGSASAALVAAAAFLGGLAAIFSRLLVLAGLAALAVALVFARGEKPVVGPPPRPLSAGTERVGRVSPWGKRRIVGLVTGVALAVAATRAITAIRHRRRG